MHFGRRLREALRDLDFDWTPFTIGIVCVIGLVALSSVDIKLGCSSRLSDDPPSGDIDPDAKKHKQEVKALCSKQEHIPILDGDNRIICLSKEAVIWQVRPQEKD